MDNIILLYKVIDGINAISLKELNDSYINNRYNCLYAKQIYTYTQYNNDIYEKLILNSQKEYTNKLISSDTLKMPVSQFKLISKDKSIIVYPTHFNHLIAEVGILYEESIIEESYKHIIEIKLPGDSSNILESTVNILLRNIYQNTMPYISEFKDITLDN